jgi:hypothetical protein
MFMIGGYTGNVPKFYGPVERRYCFTCGKEGDFILFRLRSSLSLFFVPVLPVKTTYHLVCPFCGRRIEITQEQFRNYLKLGGFVE